ncbi:hypothetical protein [Pseudoduganella namucuonensis]|uniref:hypothetical protein n=1 Tax=Pseudoduganella namucuonensis TaxID=1035707 RepID=UPI0011608C75|nr:hypothetical protein [Pseudoduganella namucuonensis]
MNQPLNRAKERNSTAMTALQSQVNEIKMRRCSLMAEDYYPVVQCTGTPGFPRHHQADRKYPSPDKFQLRHFPPQTLVVPAQAGSQVGMQTWIPACAGMTLT